MKKNLAIIAFALLFSVYAEGAEKPEELIYFYSKGCDKCIHIKESVMPGIEERFRADVRVVYKDIGDVENYKYLFELKKKYSEDEKTVFPVLFLKGRFIDERSMKMADIGGRIASFITDSLAVSEAVPLTSEKSDPVDSFRKFTLPAVLIAGFIDGINPCSFTVMIFFISFIFLRSYDRKTIIAAGCAFILASFITYLAIGLGLLGSLQALKGYRTITGAVTVMVGALSAILGVISLYDAFIFLKTKRPEDSVLKLPVRIKNKIHRLVNEKYRVRRVFFVSMAIGFSVSILESVCTGQLYLPTIIFVLKTTPYKLQALFYLLTYNMMFIIPLVAIFLLALAGVSSQKFAAVFRKYFFILKVLLALLFLALGASLVFAEDAAPKTISSAPKPERPNDPFYWNFGKVKEGDILNHRFFIKNETKEPFKIKQVNTSCSCTVSSIKKDRVLPGRKVSLEVQFDTKGYPGERTRYTYVHTDSDKVGIIVFEIRAEVIK